MSTFFVVIFSFFSTHSHEAKASSLKDIPTRSSAEINYLLSNEILQGYPDGLFHPQKSVTRGEAVKMVGSAIGLDGTQRKTSFSDVKKDYFGSGFIQSAREKGLIPNDSTFRPKEPMTRGEMALLLEKAFELTETSNKNFSDVASSGELHNAIDRIATARLAAGYPDGTFRPNANMTREEFSLFVARALNEAYRVASAEKPVEKPIENPVNVEKPIKEAVVNVASWDSLNVRSGPSADDAVVGSFKAGTKVSIYQYEGDWAYVQSGNVTGYVNKYYLATPSDGKARIAIDPGHGGSDPGAVGIGGLQEKELNLAVALKVETLLKQMGIEVVMTRRDDTFPSLSQRVDIAVNQKADAFVSIHGNSATASASGTETYYSMASTRADSSKQLATFIQKRLVPALGTKDRGVKTANYLVIYKTPLPSALVELGFISNNSDAKKLASDEYRNKAAEAIALGIQDYYNWKN